MVNYSCPNCGKCFKQKGHYIKHMTKKNPCDNITKIIENIVNKIVDKKIQEFNKRRTASPQREGTLSRRDSSKESKKDFKVDAILLDIGHTEGSAVSEERIERFNDVLFNFNTKTVGAQKFINEILSTAKITLTKTPAKDKQGDKIHDIVVELEASSVNRARADIDSSEADKIQVALTKILDDTNWPSSKGSDTPIDIVGKKALNLFVDKKSKRRKTNITEQKINNRKAKGSGSITIDI